MNTDLVTSATTNKLTLLAFNFHITKHTRITKKIRIFLLQFHVLYTQPSSRKFKVFQSYVTIEK